LVVRMPKFEKLKSLIDKGKNLLIIEIDGPHEEDKQYYMKKYSVDEDFIIDNTMEASINNLAIMLRDTLHPFGHGYCLAMALQSLDINDISHH